MSEPDESIDDTYDGCNEGNEDEGRLSGFAVDFVYDFLIVVQKTIDECHVSLVGFVEEVNDVADEEGQHAKENIAQRVVEDGQCERYGTQTECREVDVHHGEDC